MYQRVLKVSRETTLGFRHFFTVLEDSLGRWEVLDFNRHGPQLVPWECFDDGEQDFRVDDAISAEGSVEAAVMRAKQVLSDDVPYNLVLNNCEHTVNWVLYGERRSLQVEGIAKLGLVGIAVWALTRE